MYANDDTRPDIRRLGFEYESELRLIGASHFGGWTAFMAPIDLRLMMKEVLLKNRFTLF